MREFKGKVAVITGAGSGIGRALALQLAREGCLLAISDIQSDTLDETRRQAETLGATVHAQVLDVADRVAFHAYADAVAACYGRVNLVLNNAGVDLNAPISTMTYEEFEWIFNINFWGVFHGTKAFLPHLIHTGDGHIVNISSVFGIFCVPTQGAYHMAKFAVRGLTETLRMELDVMNCGVSATCVHPGGIKTNIVRGSRTGKDMGLFAQDFDESVADFDKMAKTTPEQAARVILNGVRKNKRRVLIGNDARVLDWFQRHFPVGYQKIVVAITKRRLTQK